MWQYVKCKYYDYDSFSSVCMRSAELTKFRPRPLARQVNAAIIWTFVDMSSIHISSFLLELMLCEVAWCGLAEYWYIDVIWLAVVLISLHSGFLSRIHCKICLPPFVLKNSAHFWYRGKCSFPFISFGKTNSSVYSVCINKETENNHGEKLVRKYSWIVKRTQNSSGRQSAQLSLSSW